MCSETSPRISFSHDLGQADDIVPVERNESRRDTMLLEPNSDFEFVTSSCLERESCSADELFANGVILPFQVQDRIVASEQVPKSTPPPTVSSLPPLPHPRPSNENNTKMVVNYEEKQAQSKSFWGFKRSSSLNCDVKKSLIFSLPLLSRSNSTGSVSNKRASFKDTSTKQTSRKQPLTSNGYQSQQRPPLKKGYVGSYGNGVKMSPALNVPPPYISKGTASLFGLGSLLRSGRDKKKNK